jgi:hypothetical protein
VKTLRQGNGSQRSRTDVFDGLHETSPSGGGCRPASRAWFSLNLDHAPAFTTVSDRLLNVDIFSGIAGLMHQVPLVGCRDGDGVDIFVFDQFL